MNRREFIKRATALGVASSLAPSILFGCDEGDDLPLYEYEGPLGPENAFEHGVASGDPLSDAVVLWTRVTTGSDTTDRVSVFLEVSTDPSMRRRRVAEYLTTDAERDHTVRVDLAALEPGTTYYYRFSALGRTSAIGRTKTAAVGRPREVRLAFASCSNVGFGYFYAYRMMARRADLDAVVHLGDYLYEYGAFVEYGEVYGGFREDLDPPGQIVTLDDYRRRYAFYRRDPDLQLVHRQNPFIHVWDDHEFACDPYVGGADNHFPETQGPWADRVANALTAYSEWMPTRLGAEGRIFRRFAYGDLVDLVLVDRQRPYIWPSADDAGEHLGAEQQQWLDDRLDESAARWFVLGQGTTFAPHSPDMLGGSSWDAVSRARVLDRATSNGRNLIVVTGDIHRAEALDIVADPSAYDGATGAGSVGVEFSTGSITSPGGSTDTSGPQFHWADGSHRTFLLLTLTPELAHADFIGFPEFQQYRSQEPYQRLVKSFRVEVDSRHAVESEEAASAHTDAPPFAPPEPPPYPYDEA